MKTEYRSRLPHIVPIGGAFFVTFRLNDSLPRQVIDDLKKQFDQKIAAIKRGGIKNKEELIWNERKKMFGRYDKKLDNKPYGACYLKKNSGCKNSTREDTCNAR